MEITKRMQNLKRLAGITLLFGMLTTGPTGWANELYELAIHPEGNVARLQLITDAGSVENAELLSDQSGLLIHLKEVKKARIDQLAKQMLDQPTLIKTVKVTDFGNDRCQVLLVFEGKGTILDETMSASADGRSHWEIVLAKDDQANSPRTSPRLLDLSWHPSDTVSPQADRLVNTPEGVALTLLSAYDKALAYDPRYQQAKAEFEANQEAFPQALAGYLPTASYDYQLSHIDQSVASTNPVYQPGSSNYSSSTSALTITQPIVKVPAFIKIEQADVAIEQAKLSLVAAEQDLILRLATGYLNLLASQDALELARAERSALAAQNDMAQVRYKSGLSTSSQVHDVEARLALSQAREIEAQNKFDDARGGLKEIIGVDVASLSSFSSDFEAAVPQPNDPDLWIKAAIAQNLAMQSRVLSMEVAGLEVWRQKAGYLPTLNLSASHVDQETGGSVFGQGSNVSTNEVGLKLNVPIFEGGMTNSLVREAGARKVKIMQEHEQEYRKTERMTRSSLLSVSSSIQSMDALRTAVRAQQIALEEKLQGLRSGVTTVVQVIDAYKLFYSAQREFLQARYEYLLNRLKLKQAIGALSRQDLEEIAALLD